MGPTLQIKTGCLPLLPTPINHAVLAEYLKGYDVKKINYLLEGYSNGFRLEYEGDRGFPLSSNLKSAQENKKVVSEKIAKELKEGRIAGPFSELPFNSLKISPLGIVPKKTQDQFRMIHHLSYPTKQEGSVNAGISDDSAAVNYAGIHDAVGYIKELGIDVFCCKTDIRFGFRILPVFPQDSELLGFMWEDKYYFDRCLPMGCRTSCKIVKHSAQQ